MLKSENARLSGWVYVDIRGPRPRARRCATCSTRSPQQVQLPPGYSISWSGQFEYLERATARLKIVVPATLAHHLRAALSHLPALRRSAARSWRTLPFALVGGFWLLWLLGHNLSVASAVGFIALAGVAAEFGVVMLLYLKQRMGERASSAASRVNEADAASRRSAKARCCACGPRR